MTVESAVIDAEVEEVTVEPNEQAGSLVVQASPALAVTPTVKAEDLAARLDVIQTTAEKAMVVDVDYGKLPGTKKDCLFKPGAEKLAVLFQLDVQLENEKHFDGDHLTVISKATAFHAPTGTRLGFGEGMCSSRESKYAYRQQKRTCPNCGQPAVIKGKAEYGGGWLCFKKQDGCGSKWPDGAKEIEAQAVGQVENPDLPDTWNTVLKMAEKRARVDAVLAVTGASALFTQDVEDLVERQDEPSGQPDPGPSPEPVETPFTWERMTQACSTLTKAEKQTVGRFIGVADDGSTGKVNQHRIRQVTERLEAGDLGGLMTMIGGTDR